MYSFLLVDDETYMRSAIMKLIDWKCLKINHLYQAANGKEAIRIIQQNHIDLVLTDIEMPIINGLELSKWIALHAPSTTVVIITGHEQFDYAKQCLKYGVKEYILKPMGTVSLTKKLAPIIEKMDREKEKEEQLNFLKQQVFESQREKLLTQLVCFPPQNDKDIQLSREDVPKSLDLSHTAVAILENEETHNLNTLLNEEVQTLKNLYQGKHAIFQHNNTYIIVLFEMNKITQTQLRSEKAINQFLFDEVTLIKKTLFTTLHKNVTCGIGGVCHTIEEIYFSYLQALKALGYRYLLGKNKIYSIHEIKACNTDFYYPEKMIQNLIYSIKFEKKASIQQALSVIEQAIVKEKTISPANIQLIYLELLTLIFKELHTLPDVDPSIWTEGFHLYATIQESQTCKIALENIGTFSLSAASQFSKMRNNAKQVCIEQTREIIKENYARPNLSLSEIAEKLNISAGYLSTIFKKETGESISQLISKTRVEKAMELLQSTNKMTYEVAEETGFDSSHYFSYAFKKICGYSPTEFREIRKGL